jgi:hypothetical protein
LVFYTFFAYWLSVVIVSPSYTLRFLLLTEVEISLINMLNPHCRANVNDFFF